MWFSSHSPMSECRHHARRYWLAQASMGIIACISTVPLMGQTSVGIPREVMATLPDATLKGMEPVRFMGRSIYEISLWAGKGFDLNQYENQPFALTLVYARSFESKTIAERSLGLMADVGVFESSQKKAWLALMEKAFPDVGPKDRITGAHDGNGRVRFWHNGRETATTQDPQFARLFFGIWLSPQSKIPALRLALLKAKNG